MPQQVQYDPMKCLTAILTQLTKTCLRACAPDVCRYPARPSKSSMMEMLEGDALYGVAPVLAALTAGAQAHASPRNETQDIRTAVAARVDNFSALKNINSMTTCRLSCRHAQARSGADEEGLTASAH